MSRTPRYTDLDRYRVPYKPANKTDVAATFRRVRAERSAAEEETKTKVAPLRKTK